MKLRLKSMLGAIALTAVVPAAFAADVTLRFHQFLPPQANVPHLAIEPWAKKVEKDSGGRIKVQLFPSMQLGGKPPELFDQAKDGVVDLAWIVMGFTPGRFPKTEAFELPFTVGAAESGSRAFYEFVAEKRDGRIQGRQADRRPCPWPGAVPQQGSDQQARRPERHEDPRRLAHRQHHARAARRDAGRHAGHVDRRSLVEGRDRCDDDPVRGRAVAAAAPDREEPHHLLRRQGPVYADLRAS